MADFSTNGIPGMPTLTGDALREGGDPRVAGWVNEAVLDGDRINKDDPSYDMAAIGMDYIVGRQRKLSPEDALAYLPKMTINEARKVTQAHASVLTDLKPVWAYKSNNPLYQEAGNLLNKIIIAWYINTLADLELANTVKFALAGGTADTCVEWDPHARFGGDHRIIAKDFRDTLPWRPAPGSRSVQDWQGVVFREEHSINVLRGIYPTKAHLFRPTADSILGTLMGRFRSIVSSLTSPAADTLSGLTGTTHNLKPKSANCLFYRTFLDDQSRNLTLKDIPMGQPGASWAYVVPPGGKMYPNKRLILSTPEAVIFDGPSPFWHGMFPFSRMKLWEVPWQFNGVPLLNDLIPVQDAINDGANDIRLGIKQWLNPTTVYDRQAVSETFMRLFDPRRPGAKVKTNPAYGEGFKKLDGPSPQVLSLAMQYLQWMTDKFGDLSGVANLQALLQLRQMPGADTIRQYYEAMTPELRAEGRAMEAYLRDLAEMLKVNTFQYMSQAKRVTLLGDAGLTLNDFDYDPGNLVPSMDVGQPGYTPELDASVPRDQRAQYFHKSFIFTVAPNSILAMNAAEAKMLRMQLARMGMYDFWSLGEALEIPNMGLPPAIPLPPLTPPDPIEVMASMVNMDGRYTLDPATGQVMEVRVPETVTERLMAQMQLGIGGSTNPAAGGGGGESGGSGPPGGGSASGPGRKSSGQDTPKQETKSDGRSTMTESQH
jgi:hypothetical protein